MSFELRQQRPTVNERRASDCVTELQSYRLMGHEWWQRTVEDGGATGARRPKKCNKCNVKCVLEAPKMVGVNH